jgi:hypothetical protein
MADRVSIPARFKGPPASGHGGYSAALAAQFVDGQAEVVLRAPPPLETPLTVERGSDGAVRLLDGETVVAEARTAALDLELPAPVSVDEAAEAASRSPLLQYHPFGTCFVCGTEREEGDGLRLFAGPVEGRQVVAVPWTPHSSLADDGAVRFEFVWSVLDCPSGNAIMLIETSRPSVLARLAVDIVAPVKAGEPHVAIGWPIGRERRKLHTGSAIHTADGELCAYARALWVELRDDQVASIGTTEGASPG